MGADPEPLPHRSSELNVIATGTADAAAPKEL
jgi:hypothetical protein